MHIVTTTYLINYTTASTTEHYSWKTYHHKVLCECHSHPCKNPRYLYNI